MRRAHAKGLKRRRSHAAIKRRYGTRLHSLLVGPKTDHALRYALQYFSIPQVRRAIKYVVKDAAAFSMRGFNAHHSRNTIPLNLIRYVDRVLSNEWRLYPILKDWKHEEAVLTTMLFDRVLRTGQAGFMSLSGALVGAENVELPDSVAVTAEVTDSIPG
jgi:hypothetical protein